MSNIIAIDPGKSGGLAWVDNDGNVTSEKMPDGMTAQVDFLRELAVALNFPTVLIEKVGFHRKGNGASSSAKFARHVGHLEAGCYALGMPFEEVAPGVWMRHLGTLPKGSSTKEVQARKNAIKELMARKHPHLKVTLAKADALGILSYAIHRGMDQSLKPMFEA